MPEDEEVDLTNLTFDPKEDTRKEAEAPLEIKHGYNFSVYSSDAKKVSLVGDFNNWIDNRTPMEKNKNSVWSVTIPLKKGVYSYKFSIDGVWVIDNKNTEVVKDRTGDRRSVINVKKEPKYYAEAFYFGLKDASTPVIDRGGVRFTYKNKFAKSVSISGTFNNWEKDQFYLKKNQHGVWVGYVQMQKGEYYYKFNVDGLWKYDINNPLKANDGQGDFKSVLKIDRDIEDRAGKPIVINYEIKRFTFYSKDLPSKYSISVVGSFNNWRTNINIMTDNDFNKEWFTTVRLKNGKYFYKFYLSGKEFFDPINKRREKDPNDKKANYFDIKLPNEKRNVKFSYKSPSAKSVYLVGDFNNWNPEADRMEKDQYGLWYIVKKLKPKKYGYQYIVDRKWILDPVNPFTVYDNSGAANSFFEVK